MIINRVTRVPINPTQPATVDIECFLTSEEALEALNDYVAKKGQSVPGRPITAFQTTMAQGYVLQLRTKQT